MYKLMIKTARSWGVPPVQVLMGEQRPWSWEDSLLSAALVMLEEETCRDCGTVSWLGHSTNRYIGFEVEEAVCYACAELEGKRKESEKSKKSTPGAKPYVVPFTYGEVALPSREAEFERRSRKD